MRKIIGTDGTFTQVDEAGSGGPGGPVAAEDVSIVDSAADFTATDVEGALAELQAADEADEAALSAHLSDATDAHDASAISIVDAANDFTATEVEGALAELQAADEADEAALAAHLSDSSDAHDASAISSVAAGSLAATDVQAALNELDTEKAPLASPALTGNPTAPTASVGDNDTSIATTAFVTAAVAGVTPDWVFFMGNL